MWFGIKNTTSSPSSPSCSTSNSSSSSTSTFSLSRYRNSFLLSRLVRISYKHCSEPVPDKLLLGFIATYIAPLAFVLAVTMGKEAYDDYKRNQRDKEANSQKYLILESSSAIDSSYVDAATPPTRAVPSSKLRVGDLVVLEKNQRVPADLVLLRTSDASGTCFIRTDQLDGETDWKLRVAVPSCQKLLSDKDLLGLDAEIYGKLMCYIPLRISTQSSYSRCTHQGHSHLYRHILNQRLSNSWRRRCPAHPQSRTTDSRKRSLVEYSPRCWICRRICSLHRKRNSRSYEHESPRDQDWTFRFRDQSAGQGSQQGSTVVVASI